MTDPFSVAGSAVGVASLGISILQGFVKYCTTYKDKDQDIATLSARCEGLLSIFEILEPRLQQIKHDPAAVSVVERSIRSCQTTLSRLSDQLQKLQKPDISADIKERIRRKGRHFLYPLNHHAVENLNRTLSDLQANLHIAMDVLHLSIASRHNLKPDEVSPGMSGASSGQINDFVQEPFAAMGRVQHSGEDLLTDTRGSKTYLISQSFIQDLCALRTEITRHNQRSEELMLQSLDNFGSQLESLRASSASNADDSNIKEIEYGIKSLQLAAIGKPSLLRDLCRNTEDLQTSANSAEAYASDLSTSTTTDILIKAKNRPFRMGCCCRKRRTMVRTWNQWPQLSAFSYQESEHERSCPLSLGCRDSNTFGIRIARIGFLLSKAVKFSIKISCGAGGYSISQNLNLAGVVHRDSPAFKLILKLSPRIDSKGNRVNQKETNALLSSGLQELEQLFQENNASPLDVDEDGQTLLHYASESHYYLAPDSQSRLVEGLVGLGVPANEVDRWQRTFLDNLIGDGLLGTFEVAHRAEEIGAEVSNPEDLNPSAMTEFLKLQELANMYRCGPLSLAVLDRSWMTVLKILSSDPNAVHERNDNLQTPLHLAADWPEAVQVLLETGADPNITDRFMYLPVSYACSVGNVTPVERLLKVGCNFWREEYPGVPAISTLQDSVPSCSDTLAEVVIEHLLQRREELKNIALAHSVDVPAMKTIDKDCYRIIETLGKSGVHVPASLKVPYSTTVFHTEDILLPDLQLLEDSGFVDIFEEDFRGLTPLAMRALDGYMAGGFVSWIIAKYLEAPPENEYEWNEIVAATNRDQSLQWSRLSLLIYCFSRYYSYSYKSQDIFFQVLVQQQKRSIFRRDAGALRHQSFCPCNADLSEYTTLSLGLREILSRCAMPYEIFSILRRANEMYGHQSMADDAKEKFKRLFIRLHCMELLEIPHFCCTVRRMHPSKYDKTGILCRRMEEDDVEALLEEHKAAISELNRLVGSFSARECSGSMGLGDVWLFLVDRCWNLWSADKATEKGLAGIRSAGVVIEEVERNYGGAKRSDGLIYDKHLSWIKDSKEEGQLRAMAQYLDH